MHVNQCVSEQALEADLRNKYDQTISYNDVMSAAMYPKVFDEYRCGTCRCLGTFATHHLLTVLASVLTRINYAYAYREIPKYMLAYYHRHSAG